MRGHNICFRWEVRKVIFELSSIPPFIWSFVTYTARRMHTASITHIYRGAKLSTPVTLRQPTRLTTSNAVEINRREQGVNTSLRTTCHGSNWSMASCSQTGISSLLLLIDFSRFVVLRRVGCLWVTGVLSRCPTGAPVAQWVKRWPTVLADRVRFPFEAKSS